MPAEPSHSYDLIVYGATSSGAAAAVAAARTGLDVVLAEPTSHVGGMLTGGLARTDIERQEDLVGGLAREVFERIGRHYDSETSWRFEPKVATGVLRDMLAEAGVELLLQWPLGKAERHGDRLIAIVAQDGRRLPGRCFVDASYEGDLLAAAGLPYDLGRDGRDRYGETLAGRAEMLPHPHQFQLPVSALSEDGTLLPYVHPYEDLAPVGYGDGKLQSYCYRVCLTDDPSLRLPLPEPAGYDPDRYVMVRRYLESLGDDATLRHFMGLGRLPNGKVDVNSGGPVSTNLLGASWDYPEADAERRREIAEEHLSWAHGLLFFLANDPGVPPAVREDMSRYGLPADEFVESGHWPPQLYVRDGRRLRGEAILTEADLQVTDPAAVPDAVAMGGYNIDIREVQWVAAPVYRFPDVFAEVLTEGYVSVPVDPYPVPYRTLLPRRGDCANLLVTTCVSASHVAFASFRMESQFLMAGHAGGLAAALAVDAGCAVHDVDVHRLQSLLRAEGQVLQPPR